MKKKRVPFFTICALLCAAVLFYLNNQKSRETLEHVRAEIAPEVSSTGPEQASLGQDLQFVADPETKKSEPAQDSVLAGQQSTVVAKTNKNSALKSENPHASAPRLSSAHANLTDFESNTPEQLSQATALHTTAQHATAAHIATSPQDTPSLATAPAISREVIVKNSITPTMLAYAHWTGTYSPTLFEIEVNGSRLEQDAQTKIALDQNNNFTVSYRYSFMNGYKTGARKVTFSVKPENNIPENNIIELGFSWKNKWHVISDQATHELIEDIK
jgi:hypothetical protein